MAEYIERGALLKRIRKHCANCDARFEPRICLRCGMQDAKAFIKEAPTADVVEVVHGRWVGLEYDGYADGNPVYDLWECSECGNEERGEDVPETHPFCNWCGARMDGDKQ